MTITEILIPIPNPNVWNTVQKVLFKQGCRWRDTEPSLIPYPPFDTENVHIVRKSNGGIIYTRNPENYPGTPIVPSSFFTKPTYTLL